MTTNGTTAAAAFWSQPPDQVFAALHVSSAGLTSGEAAERLRSYGRNQATRPRRASALWLLAAQFASPITLLLFVAAVLSIAVGERVDGAIILGILCVSGLLGAWQERRAAGAVADLLALIGATARVLRDGKPVEVPIEEVVPGDVVCLAAGSAIPADARLLESKDLFVDEAALTGESFPAEKSATSTPADALLSARSNALYMGTHVVSGSATALVVHTGAATEFGAIAKRLTAHPTVTEFEHGVRRFGYLLLEIVTLFVVAIFAINVALDRPVLDSLLFALALAVGLTPQLLPAIVSATLSQGARRMARERVIVRRLASIEDLGGMQVLCIDKTGTITEGVVAAHSAEDWTGAPSDRARLFAYLNAAFETGLANPIDEALRADPPPNAGDYTKLDEVPYDFVRRRLSVAVADRDGRRLLVVKGSLDSVLGVCDRAEDAAGRIMDVETVRADIGKRFAALSSDGYRCLGVAYRELTDAAVIGRNDERGLVFLGILTLADPLKQGVGDTLRELGTLGIRVTLVTGDNRLVAARIAGDAGIDASRLLTGEQVHHLSESALVAAAPQVAVFAEIEPNQKERIILALKRAGFAVGYLGDGINDAPALHAADVGISVDTAADVTKQAADVVLLEKDLGVLCRGVREGRRAFANTLKYVFITTSANFGNMFSMAGASLIVPFLPLLPKQILLINVLTDLPAMAIATDRLDAELVERPRRWDNRSIRRFMLVFGLVSSIFDYMTFGALFLLRAPPATFRTAWFLESVLSELLILLVIRTRRTFFRSRLGNALLWSSVGVTAVTVCLPYSPLAGPLGFAAVPLPLLGVMAGITLLYLVTSEMTKRAVFRHVSL